MGDKTKAVIAFLYAVAAAAIPVFDGRGGVAPRPSEWVTILIAVATAASVYIAPLVTQYSGVKTAIGAVLAGLQVLVTVIDGGVHGTDVLTIVVAVAAALGIWLAPARSVTGVAVGWGSDRVVAG